MREITQVEEEFTVILKKESRYEDPSKRDSAAAREPESEVAQGPESGGGGGCDAGSTWPAGGFFWIRTLARVSPVARPL